MLVQHVPSVNRQSTLSRRHTRHTQVSTAHFKTVLISQARPKPLAACISHFLKVTQSLPHLTYERVLNINQCFPFHISHLDSNGIMHAWRILSSTVWNELRCLMALCRHSCSCGDDTTALLWEQRTAGGKQQPGKLCRQWHYGWVEALDAWRDLHSHVSRTFLLWIQDKSLKIHLEGQVWKWRPALPLQRASQLASCGA